ncbi:hypothetical protein BC628DRAFT_1300549, partial [Trametes gibbosa]
VDDLLGFWSPGVWFSRTAKHSSHHLVRAALIPLICDILAARQVSGLGSHASTYFCSFCYLKLEDIENIDKHSWPQRSSAMHRENARRWKDARSVAEREKVFQEFGVRWSELLRLPYWDPVRFTVVDSMHNLYLGLIKTHCRDVWGMKVDAEDGDAAANPQKPPPLRPSSQAMEKGLSVLYSGSFNELLRCPKGVLWHLCEERDLRRAGTVKVLAKELDKWVRTSITICLTTQLLTEPSELVERARKTLLTSKDPSVTLVRYRKDALASLCQQYGVSPEGTKKELARRLAAAVADAPATSPTLNDNFGVAHETSESAQETRSGPALGQEAFSAIREVREAMQLPSWINPVPRGFGTSEHGKLSADQWHTTCTVLLPVALILLWGNEKGRKWDMLKNFMDLAAAVVLAGIWRISSSHIDLFEQYLHRYIAELKILYKEAKIVPNHHLALHLPDFMRLFGPVQSWRSFVFERFNYILQNINSNLTFGEMEGTFMKTSCRAANLKPMLQDPRVAVDLEEFLKVYGDVSGEDERGMRLESVLRSNDAPFVVPDLSSPGNSGRESALSSETYIALLDRLNAESSTLLFVDPSVTAKQHHQRYLSHTIFNHSDIIIHGIHYRPQLTSSRDSNVQFHPHPDSLVAQAGSIQSIFTHRRKLRNGEFVSETFLAVKHLVELSGSDVQKDNFRKFPHAGGRLHYDEYAREVHVVRPQNILCHIAKTPLRIAGITKACVHVLPLDRV